MNEHEIPLTQAEFSSTSFMDPNGRVFQWKGDIYRALVSESSQFYKDFIESDTCNTMISTHQLVDTSVTNYKIEGYAEVLKHRKISHPSYCFEWAPEMLKDAALLTLDLCIELLKRNATLQDAYPWNVFFEGTRPVHIDFSSIVAIDPAYVWIPYQQFCDFFYHPLLLSSAGHRLLTRRLQLDYLNGIQANEVRAILSFGQKLRSPDYFTRVALPSFVSKMFSSPKWEAKLRQANSKMKVNISNHARLRFFEKLRKTIERIPLNLGKTVWKEYYSETEAKALETKKKLFRGILGRLQPQTTLDIGCNAGEFSMIAAEAGSSVVAFDTDEACVSRLYESAKARSLNVLPLVMDVLNPSPSFGWCNKQFAPAHERFKSDLVCMFAVIHHLVFSKGQNFERVIQSIQAFQKPGSYALIEFVSKEDPMANRLRRRIGFNDDWYNLENFKTVLSRFYKTVEVAGNVSETRTLLLCQI